VGLNHQELNNLSENERLVLKGLIRRVIYQSLQLGIGQFLYSVIAIYWGWTVDSIHDSFVSACTYWGIFFFVAYMNGPPLVIGWYQNYRFMTKAPEEEPMSRRSSQLHLSMNSFKGENSSADMIEPTSSSLNLIQS
jgi:hypothetical protein